MKICDKHQNQLTGDGECLVCEKESLHEIIFKLQVDRNLGNSVIQDQRQQIQKLENELKQLKQLKQSLEQDQS